MSRRSSAAQAFLHAHGIDVAPDAFEALVREAVASFNPAQYRAEAQSELTTAEAVALRRAGLEITPAEGAADDPMARTAAEFAALVTTGLTTTEAARRLRLDPSRIRQLLAAPKARLYAIRLESGW